MKKLLILFLTVVLTFSLAACKSDNDKDSDKTDKQTSAENKDNDKDKDKEKDTADSKNEQTSVNSALDLLNTVWNSYKDDEKFPAAGGDMSEENMSMSGPGKYGLEDTEALDSTLGLSADSAAKVDDAASLVHMMNANTFTCGVFHVKNADDLDTITTSLKEHIMQRQWLCGFPDKLVILTVDDYIISFFGENEIMDTFKAKVTAAYSSAKVVCEQPIE